MKSPRRTGARAPKSHQDDIDMTRFLRARRTPYRIDQWSDRFEEWERSQFEKTGNPLHVWNVIGAATGSNGQEERFPIPDWCQVYLAEVAARLEVLATGIDCRTFVADTRGSAAVSPDQAADMVPFALGLRGDGWNAFKEITGADRSVRAMQFYDHARNRGASERQACDYVREAMQKTGDNPPAHDRTIHALVAQGRTASALAPKDF